MRCKYVSLALVQISTITDHRQLCGLQDIVSTKEMVRACNQRLGVSWYHIEYVYLGQ